MLDRRDLVDVPGSMEALIARFEATTEQLEAALTLNARWRAGIERHLQKGCPSRSLRALLMEANSHPHETR